MCDRISDSFIHFHVLEPSHDRNPNCSPWVYTPLNILGTGFIPGGTAQIRRGIPDNFFCLFVFNPQSLTLQEEQAKCGHAAVSGLQWMEGMNDLKRQNRRNPVNIGSQVLRNSRSLNFPAILPGASYTIQMDRFGMKSAPSPECAEQAWRS